MLLTKFFSCAILKSANNPVEAEITAITPSQRARGAVIRAGNELSNGPPRARRNIKEPPCQYFAAYGTRQLPKICLYLKKRTVIGESTVYKVVSVPSGKLCSFHYLRNEMTEGSPLL